MLSFFVQGGVQRIRLGGFDDMSQHIEWLRSALFLSLYPTFARSPSIYEQKIKAVKKNTYNDVSAYNITVLKCRTV